MKPSTMRLANAVLVFAAVAMPVIMTAVFYVYGSPVVYLDDFDFYPVIQHAAAGHLTMSDLWAQHNEHRMLFPNLLFLLTYELYAWNNATICYITHAFAAASVVVLALLGGKTLDRRWALPAAVVFSILCFSPLQSFNFLLGFQLQWLLTTFCMGCVAYILATVERPLHAALLAAVFATIASYSLASGLSIWECVLAALVLAHVKWDVPTAATWAAIGVVVTVIYLIGWKPLYQSDPTFWLHHPVIFAHYVLTYLGSPLAFDRDMRTSTIIGFVGVTLFVSFIAAGRSLRKNYAVDLSRSMFPWITLGLFGIANAVITGIGRDAFGLGQALSSRYVTMANFIWFGVIGLAAIVVPAAYTHAVKEKQRTIALVSGLCATLFCVCLIQGVINGYSDYRHWAGTLDKGLIAEVQDHSAPTKVLDTVYNDPQGLMSFIDSMRQLKQGPFTTNNIPDAVLHYASGCTLLSRKQFSQATSEFVAAEPGMQGMAIEHYKLCRSYYLDGNVTQAQMQYQRAVALDPAYANFQYDLAPR
jgi:hypothetical protein